MPGELFPGAVEVVGHHVEDVHGLGDPGHVVPRIDDGLTGRHGSTEQEAVGFEGRFQFITPVSKGFLFSRFALRTVCLPALGVLPIQVQTVKPVLEKERDNVVNKSLPENVLF